MSKISATKKIVLTLMIFMFAFYIFDGVKIKSQQVELSNLFINENNMKVSYDEAVPMEFENHLGESIARDFDLNKKGVKLSSNTIGSSVDINKVFDGSFEMSFRAYSKVSYHDVTGTDWNSSSVGISPYIDLKEITFNFEDEDGKTFDIIISAGERYNNITPAARVRIYGSDYGLHYLNDADNESDTGLKNDGGYYTRIGGSAFGNVARRGNKLTSEDSMPVTFGFNQETMEVYVIHYGTINSTSGKYRVVARLNDENMGLKRMFNFNNYKVGIKFSDIKTNEEANLVIYDINSQKLEGLEFTNTIGPKLNIENILRGVKNTKYYLPKPKSFDFIDGTIDFNGTVLVTDPNGNNVDLYVSDNKTTNNNYQEGIYFIPTIPGNYKVVYQGLDLEGVLGHKNEKNIIILDQIEKSEYLFAGSYDDLKENYTFAEGSSINVLGASVFSPIHNNIINAFVTVRKDGLTYNLDSEIANSEYLLKDLKTGKYEIIYHQAINDYTNSETIEFEVTKDAPLFTFESDFNYNVDLNKPLNIPKLQSTLNNSTKNATPVVYHPNGERLNIQNGQYLTTPGIYKINYLVQFDKTYNFVKYINVSTSNETSFYSDDPQITIEHGDSGNLFPHQANGIKITTTKNNSEVFYNRLINLAHYNENIPLIEAMVIPSEIGALDFWQYKVRLTDKYDPSIYVDIAVFKGSWGNAWSYVRAGSNSQVLSGWENNKVLTQYNTGTPIAYSFTGENVLGSEFIKLYYDFDDHAVYVDNIKRPGYPYGNQVIDLDDPEIFSQNTIFNGFTTGEVYLSIQFEYLQNDSATILVKSIDGVDLQSEWVNDNNAPSIVIDKLGYSEAPVGLVNKAYPIFNATAFDKVEGLTKVDTKVYLNYQTANQVEIQITNNHFIPQEVGKYTIVYSSTDGMRNSSISSIDIIIKDSIPELEYILEEEIINNAYKGENYKIPFGQGVGGTGNKEVNIKITNPLNQIIQLENGTIFFSEVGNYKLEITVKDFLGQTYLKTYNINVEIKESPIITPFNIEPYYMNNKTVNLPTFESFDYNNSNPTLVKNEIVAVYNGTTTNILNNKFTPSVNNNGDVVEIHFKSTSNITNKTTTEIKYVKVFKTEIENEIQISNYFDYKNVESSNNNNGVELLTIINEEKLYEASFINSIIDSELTLEFNPNKDKNNFGSFTITLYDSLDKRVAVDLEIFKNTSPTSTTTFARVNNNEFKTITGSFYEVTSFGFNIRFNKNNNSIIDANTGRVVDFITKTKYGEVFSGFPSSKVLFKVTLNDVEEASAINIYQIANQRLANITDDRVNPLVMLDGTIKFEGDINEAFSLPKAYTSDVLSIVVETKVIVRHGSDIVFEGDLNDENSFIPTKYGVYRIIYSAKDESGRERLLNILITIKDKIKPTIEIDGSVPTKTKLNEKITLPKATVTDNNSLNLRLYVMIKDPNGYIKVLPNESFEFTPKLGGKYEVYYYTLDEYSNYVYNIYSIEVE